MFRATDRFENWFITTLETDVNDTTTTFRIGKILQVNNARLIIDPYSEDHREIVRVTSKDGNLVTVERGDDHTDPEYHLAGTLVACNVTAGDLNDLFAEWDAFSHSFDDLIADAEAATAAATAATGLANTATSNANTATGNANTATTNANTARDNAIIATTNTNTAKDAANSAASSANSAASSANSAASAANTAKDNTIIATNAAYDAIDALVNVILKTDTNAKTWSFVIDEDNMASNLDTKLPTQQSVKKYVDDKTVNLVPNTRTINGTALTSDIVIVALPDQAGANDKYLRSNGTTAAWNTLPNLANQVYDQLMSGVINGVNTVFTTASNFASILVFKNGVTLHVGDDYTITGANQITMVTAPATGTKITCLYNTSATTMINGSNSWKSDEVPAGLVNSSNCVFTTSVPYIANSLEYFVNGIKQTRGVHFAETTPGSGIFTTSEAPTTGDNVMVNYQFVLSVSGNADTLDGSHAPDFYPVGTLYSNKTNSANPSTYLPGQAGKTWVALPGVVVVGKAASGTFATAGATVGVETVTLDVTQIPAHSHTSIQRMLLWDAGATSLGGAAAGTTIQTTGWGGTVVNNTGGGLAHTNIQPSVVAYVWERTA